MIFIYITLGVFGGIIVLASIFLYEGEERKIQGYFEELWIDLHDKEKTTRGFVLNFARDSALACSRAFDALFGKTNCSIRASVATFLFSYLSYGLYKWIFVFLGEETIQAGRTEHCMDIPLINMSTCVRLSATATQLGLGWQLILTSTMFILIALAVKLLPEAKISFSRFFLLTLLLSSLPALVESALSIVNNFPRNHWRMLTGPILMLATVGSDFTSIAMTRHVAKKASQTQSIIAIFLWILIDCLVVLSLFALPIFLAFLDIGGDWTRAGFALAGSNTTASAPSLIWLTIALILLLHQLLWPTVLRGLYALARSNIFSQRKKLATFGTTLIATAIAGKTGKLNDLFEALVKLLAT